MFKNPGATLKIVSKILFLICFLGLFLTGIIWVADDRELGWAFLLCSFPVCFIVFLPLIAFGQLCEDTAAIREKISPKETNE